MQFYSSVPLLNGKDCPKASDHNRLARQVNRRLVSGGPATVWSIFSYADSIFTNMRNSATPGIPLGVNPPEDEWWKIYAYIEHPTAETGEGNWPLVPAGFPEGANVMNPVNAYIFGRITAENSPDMPSRHSGTDAGSFPKDEHGNTSNNDVVAIQNDPRIGPWAEGNIFDGLVEGSRAALSNRTFWEMSFRQRGAVKLNYNSV